MHSSKRIRENEEQELYKEAKFLEKKTNKSKRIREENETSPKSFKMIKEERFLEKKINKSKRSHKENETLPESFKMIKEYKKCEKSTLSGLKCFSSLTKQTLNINHECLHFCDKHRLSTISNLITILMTQKANIQTNTNVDQTSFPEMCLYFSFDEFIFRRESLFFSLVQKNKKNNNFEVVNDFLDLDEKDVGRFIVETFREQFQDQFQIVFKFYVDDEGIQESDVKEVFVYFNDEVVYLNYIFDQDQNEIVVQVSQDSSQNYQHPELAEKFNLLTL